MFTFIFPRLIDIAVHLVTFWLLSSAFSVHIQSEYQYHNQILLLELTQRNLSNGECGTIENIIQF